MDRIARWLFLTLAVAALTVNVGASANADASNASTPLSSTLPAPTVTPPWGPVDPDAPPPPPPGSSSYSGPPPLGRPGTRPVQPLPFGPPPAPMIFFEQSYGVPIRPGSRVRAGVQTLPNARCSIDYVVSRGGAFQRPGVGRQRPAGLEPKWSDRVGWVTWRWMIHPQTPHGPVTFTVTCQGHGQNTLVFYVGNPRAASSGGVR